MSPVSKEFSTVPPGVSTLKVRLGRILLGVLITFITQAANSYVVFGQRSVTVVKKKSPGSYDAFTSKKAPFPVWSFKTVCQVSPKQLEVEFVIV